MATSTGSTSLEEAIAAILSCDWRDARSVAIPLLGGIAMSTVVCVRCAPDRPMTFTGAVRHLREVESARVERHPEMIHSQLHRPGDFRPGQQGEVAPDEDWWSWSPCRYCGVQVIYARTGRDKRIKIDREPNPNGSVLLVSMDSGGIGEPYARFLHTESERAEVDPGRLHTMHVNTCTKPPPARTPEPSKGTKS